MSSEINVEVTVRSFQASQIITTQQTEVNENSGTAEESHDPSRVHRIVDSSTNGTITPSSTTSHVPSNEIYTRTTPLITSTHALPTNSSRLDIELDESRQRLYVDTGRPRPFQREYLATENVNAPSLENQEIRFNEEDNVTIRSYQESQQLQNMLPNQARSLQVSSITNRLYLSSSLIINSIPIIGSPIISLFNFAILYRTWQRQQWYGSWD